MVDKAKKEKHEEVVQFGTYKKFCKDTTAEKEYAIKVGNENIERLKADIQKFTSDAERLGKEITTLDADISEWEGNLKAAAKVRQIEEQDYIKTSQDYTESIEALGKGLDELEKQKAPTKQAAAALSQVAASLLIPSEQRRLIDTFLETDPEETLATAEPEAPHRHISGDRS